MAIGGLAIHALVLDLVVDSRTKGRGWTDAISRYVVLVALRYAGIAKIPYGTDKGAWHTRLDGI